MDVEPEGTSQDQPERGEAPAARPRLTALDSEVLKIDDRILVVEQKLSRAEKDIVGVREILIDEIIAAAFLELAVAAIIVCLVLLYRKEHEHYVA